MKRSALQLILTSIFAMLLSFSLAPSHLFAAPVEVTFYPQSAQVKEVQKVRLKAIDNGLRQATITLPGQADPDTLATQLTSPSSLTIMDQTWRQVTPQDDQSIVAMRKKLAELKVEQNSLQAGIRALDTQIQFWQLQTKARVKTIADAGNMSSAIGKNITKMVQDKLALEPLLEEITKKVKEKQENLNQKIGKKESAWEVTVLLSGPAIAEATLTYTYTMSGCGWTSLYRLEAQPLKKRILFSWEAEIWQSSGQDWRQVNIRLATLQPATTITPQDLPAWIIKPRQEVIYKAKRSRVMEEKMSDEAAEPLALAASPNAAPSLSRESSFHVWNLGKRSLNAGSKQRLQVQEETWPVEFTYLARPAQGDQTFIRGAVQFQEDKEIPRGTASFMIDGALVGKRPFSLTGREDTIYFGADPLIKASSVLLSQAAGEKSFFADKQTYRWEWRTEIANGRNYPIRVRMEEPLPQSRDERIKITLKNNPEASESSPTSQIWLLDIPAGEKKVVSTGVAIEAPKSLNLDLGWRR